MRSLRNVLSVACVLAATMAAATAPAAATESAPAEDSAASVAIPNGPYHLHNWNSGLTMAITNASTANGAPAVQWLYVDNGVDNDLMMMETETTAPGLVRFKPRHTFIDDRNPFNDKCLAVQGASKVSGAPIVQAACTYDSVNNDVWIKETPIPGPLVQFRNQNSRMCLVVENASMSNGARLVQFACNGTDNSKWLY